MHLSCLLGLGSWTTVEGRQKLKLQGEMGNPKQKWTAEEEGALRAGVFKYGAGKWKFIQKDPEFNQFLHSRSNIDLKVLPFSLYSCFPSSTEIDFGIYFLCCFPAIYPMSFQAFRCWAGKTMEGVKENVRKSLNLRYL